MSTVISIIQFLLNTLGSLYLLAICLRFLMQLARADFYNPLSQLVVKLTNPLLLPLRKIIPGLWGIDMASVVLALLFHTLMVELMILVQHGVLYMPFAVLYWALIGTVLFVSHIYLILFFVVMIASFIAPYSSNPALVLCYQIVEPVLAPFRKIIPPAGGFDFSMLFAGLVIMVVRMALQGVAASSGVPLGMLLGF
ncbi:MAG TPA: YggT family protein [Cellvibrionaceae bacterium]|nr:YggT family protein [Cellvibrionaceae bacterium]HMW48966.1 YggT family protein [Cellvibrionaceae bacterium]HMW71726.1 YggT family protein [Cellvibrionaceae bacterium]HMY39446.1 YggT family protein [Marinagarivorans sp.]HNG58212.1 YggT family protein [Cellvibrionaceae bacterium]